MKQYNVTGMSCAACSARVEKAVSKVPGVTSCSVNLLTNSMGVEGSASDEEIVSAVVQAGYGASRKQKGQASSAASQSSDRSEEMFKDTQTPLLRKRLLWSLGFLIILMYFSMGHMMWGWPLPSFYTDNHIAMGLTQLLLTIIIMVINQRFFISGYKSLLKGAPNMDTLVALGSTAAFVYSTVALFAMTDAQVRGDSEAVMNYMMEFYFESAAMILTLITVGKMLESHSKGKTTDALKSLMKLTPKTATVVKDDVEQTVAVEQVQKEDIFVVRPGESIPVDGVILEGHSAVNEASLTGESIPVDKKEGDSVSAATINQSGFLKCKAVRVGEDTTLSQIIQMVSDAAATKAPIAKIADKVSGVFVPCVITIAVITTIVWLLLGRGVGFAIARGISVLVISCPCALGLATPVAIMVGNGKAAKNGILFKNAVSLEEAGKVKIVALDKTGTITAGNPQVTDLYPSEGVEEKTLLQLAANVEKNSEHPLAKAVIKKAQEEHVEVQKVSEFEALSGNGVVAKWNGQTLLGGSLTYMKQKLEIPPKVIKQAEAFANEGKTPLLFALDKQLLGVIAVADVIKEDSAAAIHQLRNMGIQVVMLTGDHERSAQAIGKQAGVDKVIAGVLPDGKEAVIRKLKEKGKVAMVGDGINDAPALTRADVGIAIGAGTDVAIDAADIVLMKSSLMDVAAAIRLSRATLRNIHENLFWAFFYNTVGIPLAAGVFISLGLTLNPMFGAAAMSLSSFCVVSNALRLNLVDIYNTKKDSKRKEVCMESAENGKTVGEEPANQTTETKAVGKENNQTGKDLEKMEKTYKIEGMMCGHCEARVKKTLESFEEVVEAKVSHESGTAVVTLSAPLDDEKVKAAIQEQGYEVVE